MEFVAQVPKGAVVSSAGIGGGVAREVLTESWLELLANKLGIRRPVNQGPELQALPHFVRPLRLFPAQSARSCSHVPAHE